MIVELIAQNAVTASMPDELWQIGNICIYLFFGNSDSIIQFRKLSESYCVNNNDAISKIFDLALKNN